MINNKTNTPDARLIERADRYIELCQKRGGPIFLYALPDGLRHFSWHYRDGPIVETNSETMEWVESSKLLLNSSEFKAIVASRLTDKGKVIISATAA